MNINMKPPKLRLLKKQISKLFLPIIFVFFNSIGIMRAQSVHQIKGTVTSEGEALIGANVIEKNTTNGTVTNINGDFIINVNKNADIVVSYLGYVSQTIKTGNQSVFKINLEADSKILDEVVAIGYGVQKKKLNTGATVQVKGDDISKLNTVNALGALQSQTSGVNITKMSGKPGDGYKVTVRGLGTIYNSNPLYVIDGVPGGDINMLNPSDIESVDVLKDAASAAIYGARAANGVILVTTKQGRKGKTEISFDGYFGWQNIAKKIKVLNAQQYVTIMKEAGYTDADFAAAVPNWSKIQNGEWTGTDWLDEMTNNNAPLQNHSINITSGTEQSVYSLGFSYTSQNPLIGLNTEDVDSKYERYTTRINSDHTLIKNKGLDILMFGQNLSMSYVDKNGLGMGTGNMYWNDVRNALKANPLFNAYDENGKYGWPVLLDAEATNPLSEMYNLRSFVNSKNYSVRGSFYTVIQPIKKLKFRSSFGFTYNGWSSREYVPIYQLNERVYSTVDRVSQGSGNGLQWNWDNTLSYDLKLNDAHKFNVLAGMSAEKWGMGEDINGQNKGSEFSDFEHAYLSNVKSISSGNTVLSGSPWAEGGLMSFFGRVNYDYNSKYMATILLRTDGSSNFSKGNRWGYFPSVSAGWNISEESFMEDSKGFLDFMKLRISWGENGNSNIPSFRYLSSIAFGTASDAALYYFGTDKSQPTTGSYPDLIANPNLKWETSRQLDAGVDARFLKNRLGFTFDWYNKMTMDWLVQPPGLGIWGTGAPWINGGDIQNTGIEMSLDWTEQKGNFSYGIKGNMSYNKNEVLRIENKDGIIEGTSGVLAHNTGIFYRAQVGYPVGYFYGYKTNGIFQNQDQIDTYVKTETGVKIMPSAKPGDVIFIDTNNDGIINDKDRTMIGNPHPDITYGLSLNVGWKGLNLSVTGYGVAGNQIAKSYRSSTNKPLDNYTEDILGRWHGEGTSNKLPIINGSLINWQYISDLYIENGDYFRITNLTLSYDLKKSIKVLPISQLQIFGTVQNLFTFTNYSGMDPEVGYGSGDSWASGIDLGSYPSARTYMVGISVKY